jgi:hypothetical protein
MSTDWTDIARRNARPVQSAIGWVFWDSEAVRRWHELGLPPELGFIASRCAPLAPAGPDAVIAAFGTISPVAIRVTFDMVGERERFHDFWIARDAAVVEGLPHHAPEIVTPVIELGPKLWKAVEQLPALGRVLYGAHLSMPRPSDPLLSGWHAINCIREWRGDTHWAIVAAAGLTPVEASILHNEWIGYDQDWIAVSRGTTADEIDAGWAALEHKGLAENRSATAAGIELRQRIEDDTDALTTLPWELVGEDTAREFAQRLEGPCERLLARVDETAGHRYMPAARLRAPRTPEEV